MNGFRKFLENKEQEEAFMRVLRSNEATYDHWLVFADSLEEKGEIEDAEMIRLLVGTDMGRVPKNEVIKRVMEIQHEDNRRQGGLRGWIDPSHPRVRTYLISPL